MMSFRRILFAGLPALILFGALPLEAARIPLRGAQALAAEYTTASVPVEGLTAHSFAEKRPSVAAQVVLVLDAKRKISRHDYTLRIDGRDYPMGGLRRGDGNFSFRNWKLSDLKPGEKVAMLFFIDSAAAEKVGPWQVRWALPQEEKLFPVLFENLNSGSLSTPSAIPDEGKFAK